MRPAKIGAGALACAALLSGCGGSGKAASSSSSNASAVASGPTASSAARARIPAGDWTRFDYDAARTGVGPADTGITARNVSSLSDRRITLDGTADSSAIELHAVPVGARKRDVVVLTTTYGRTEAFDPGTGTKLWEYVPSSIQSYVGTSQITTATPIADPNRRYVYAASPDGLIHKLAVASGREFRSSTWPVKVTRLPSREKIASALNISGGRLVVTTGGYFGDAPPYQGHVVTIDLPSGRIDHVWNSLCSNQHFLLVPSSCGSSDSAIWARAGAVVEPGSGRILVATGNATGTAFNGTTNWSDSVLELTPNASGLLQNWTPTDQARLSESDDDLGSTAPVIIPELGGRRLAVQGGKDGKLRLLDLNRLNGSGGAGPQLGGEIEDVSTPGGDQLYTAPAVWSHGGRTYVFVADNSGTGVYTVTGGSPPRLSLQAQNGSAGTSPVVAGGLLYVYDQLDALLKVYEPTGLHLLASLNAARGHWNSPIVVGGRVILPEGNANDHSSSGRLDIFHLPGR